MTIEDNI